MNKRISTLMTMGLLAAGTLFSTANAQVKGLPGSEFDDKTAIAGEQYYLGFNDGTNDLFIPGVAVTETGKEDVIATKFGAPVKRDEITSAERKTFLWTVSRTQALNGGDYYYSFTNSETKAKLYFVESSTKGQAAVISGTSVAKDKLKFSALSWVKEKYAKDGAELKPDGTNSLAYSGGSWSISTSTPPAGITLKLYKVTEDKIAAKDLNNIFGSGSGFSLKVNGKTVEDNIFAQRIKAFDVNSAINIDEPTPPASAEYQIAKGTYFAIEYPEDATSITKDNYGDFTFIAVDPADNYGISGYKREDGAGFKLITIKGSELNTYVGEDAKLQTSKDELAIVNAAFTVTEKDAVNKEGQYTLTVSPRLQLKADKDEHSVKAIAICAPTSSNVTYITTGVAGNASAFVADNSKKVNPISLLMKDTVAAAIYNIQFVSGIHEVGSDKTTEEGQYLAVGLASSTATSFSLLSQGPAMVDLSSPLYQFVISSVDTEKSEVTFTNRETNEEFTATLFKTDNEGEYLVSSTDKFGVAYVDKSDVAYQANKELAGTTIKLSLATVDKFAGFANRDKNDNEPVVLRFAKNVAASEVLFLNVQNENKTWQFKGDRNELNAAKWVLVKDDEKKALVNRHDFYYNKGGKAVRKINADSVAVNFYKIQYFTGDENELYLNYTSSTSKFDLVKSISSATPFIVKENVDGSISLIVKGTSYSATIVASAKSLSLNEKNVLAMNSLVYETKTASADKLFMENEAPAISLPAVSRHAAFGSVNGGYVSLSAKNEGVIAIATASDEDMTFWLDTADSKANVPSFFISRRVGQAAQTKAAPAADEVRLFMYDASDSLKISTTPAEKAKYQWSEDITKVIFKAAKLVNADTLSTTVNGKEALVAAKADLAGTLGGLKNFKYQIVKASANADNEYIIRSGGKYLASINGQLTMEDSAASALVVAVEDGMIPTSNENMEDSASAFSVTAGTGFVTVQGAAGKTIKISNILGKALAEAILTSDNAVINVPSGIVVVAVEGEDAVKTVVR